MSAPPRREPRGEREADLVRSEHDPAGARAARTSARLTLLRGQALNASASRKARAAATPSATTGTAAIRPPLRRGDREEEDRFVEPKVLGARPSPSGTGACRSSASAPGGRA